ncbi:MAG: hypothetical protein OXR73_25245 [Myxococcales bacterium]|nr:hypothetical protein [Myxococcales bacterium]
MDTLQGNLALVLIAVVLLTIVVCGAIFARMYRRASKETSFVRTGMGGQKVIMNGGALVLPVLHEIISVNMNTLRLEVRRAHEHALITKDRMRVDVLAEFYVRVQPTIEAIANAAQTLGQQADKARALAVQAEEAVITAREHEKAERAKRIDLVKAAEEAETKAIGVTVAAEAEKKAAEDRARAVMTLAEADASRARIVATGDAEAEKQRAEAAAARYEVDAAGRRALHEADNILSAEQIAMQVRLAVVQALPEIIAQSVKPMERIEGIKIMQVDGLTGGGGRRGEAPSGQARGGSGNLAEEVVGSALRYRAQAPLVDSLMQELGLGKLEHLGLQQSLSGIDGEGRNHDHGDVSNGTPLPPEGSFAGSVNSSP